MNMLKKGPELKLPDLKVPDFLLDIYYDLRERHLLPLVAILLVALVALPVVLTQGSSSADSAEPESEAFATPSTVQTSKLVVAKATPGLRDYRRRLAGQHAHDPFVQQYANSEGGEGTAGTGEVEAPAESGGGSPTPESPNSPEAPPATDGNGEPPESGHLRYYSFAIDTRVVPVSSTKSRTDASVRHNLPEMTMLPSRSVPALTFIGVTKDEKNAVMLVSDKVTGLFGDANCIVGSEACQLITLEPGIPETVVYGADNRTYRIELLKVRLLKTDKLNVAPTGKPKQGKAGRPQLAPLVTQPR